MTLLLERKQQADESITVVPGLLITPPMGEDYWEYRVQLTDTQSVVGFPKFTTIGIGFAVEEDWNANLPYQSSAEEIFAHIRHNKGDESISDDDVLEAIRLIQAAATEDHAHAH